jgi:hypothetical protein
MATDPSIFNPQELCSRKLWDMVSIESNNCDNKAQLEAAIAELEVRRSYLKELHDIGKMGPES